MSNLRCAAELAQNPELMSPPAVILPPCGAEGRVTLVTLGPKEGKSTTAAGMIAEASVTGTRCALLTLDEAIGDSLQRLVRCGARLSEVFLTDLYDPASLEKELLEFQIWALVVDHLGKLAERDPSFGPGSQGDPILWGRLVTPFADLARRTGLAVVLLDQARRSDGKYSGSAAKAGSIDILVELARKDGGLEGTPSGRVPLPPFRVELDPDGVPRFSGAATPAVGTPPGPSREKSRALLQFLADSEPEGLTSSGWMKVSGFPKETYNRNRRALLRDGYARPPDETRTRYYRITDRGENALQVPEVPRGTNGTAVPAGGGGTTGTTPYVIGLVPGIPQTKEPDDGYHPEHGGLGHARPA